MARGLRVHPGVVPVVLLAVLLACFGRLVADPSGLLVDPTHPSLDQNDRSPGPPAVGNDSTRLFIPHHAAIADRLARLGRVPTWDDRGFGGRPLVGNPQSGIFYPPTWLAWRVWTPATLGWVTVAHLLFAGFGTYVLARSVGVSRWGSVTAAGCFQANPYVLAQAFEGHFPHVWAVCWFPWVFWLAIRANRGSLLAGLALIPALSLSLLAGHVQEPYLLLVALVLWQFALLGRDLRARSRQAVRRLMAVGGIIALTLGFTAIEWWPEMQVAPWTLRDAPFPSEFAGRYHLFPANVLQLLSPFALGRPATYFGHDNFWEALTSIGLIPLSLALAAVAWSPRRHAIRGWLILVGLAVWYAGGRQLGLFTLLYHVVPGLSRFRVPARSLFLASLGASLLVGFGVDTLTRRASASRIWPAWANLTVRSVLVVGVLVGVGTIWLTAGPLDPGSLRGRELPRLAYGLRQLGHEPTFWFALTGLGMIAAIGRYRPAFRPGLGVGLGLLGLAELSLTGATLLKVAPAERLLGPDPISATVRAADPRPTTPPRVRAVDSWFDDLRAQDRGFHKINLNDSFQIRHAADVYETLYRVFAPESPTVERPMDAAVAAHRRAIQQAVLDRLGVQFLLANQPTIPFPWPILRSGSWRGHPFLVARNPTALPRAYVVPRAEPASKVGNHFTDFARTDPRSVVLMDRDPLPSGSDRQPYTPATWLDDAQDRLKLSVTTQGPGLLVISDTWMPGWTARVDGRSTPVLRGNHTQRVISLPDKGIHRVEVEYQPPDYGISQTICLGTASIWMGFVVVAVRKRPGRKRGFPGKRRNPTADC